MGQRGLTWILLLSLLAGSLWLAGGPAWTADAPAPSRAQAAADVTLAYGPGMTALPEGIYQFVTIRADGSTPLHTTIRVGSGPAPTPQPDPTPDPTPVNQRAEAFRSAAGKVTTADKTDQQDTIGAIYLELSRKVGSDLKGAKAIEMAISVAHTMALKDRAAWKPVTDLMTAELTTLAQNGAADSAYASLLADASAGLLGDRQSVDWEKILELVLRIIEIVMKLIG